MGTTVNHFFRHLNNDDNKHDFWLFEVFWSLFFHFFFFFLNNSTRSSLNLLPSTFIMQERICLKNVTTKRTVVHLYDTSTSKTFDFTIKGSQRGLKKNCLTCHDVVMKHMAWEFSPINIQKRNQLTLFNMLNIITLQHNADTLCQKSDSRKFQELSHTKCCQHNLIHLNMCLCYPS